MVHSQENLAERQTERVRIDRQFDSQFANALARLESYNKHLYRPNTYLHKWWARRCGTTFRLILKHLSPNMGRQDFYQGGGLEGTIILDPMIGGGTTLHEAIRLGANVIGADIDPIPLLQARATLSRQALGKLEAAFEELLAALRSKLSLLYQTNCPTCDRTTELRYVLYGLRRRCRCREAVFVDSLVLRHHSDGSETRLQSKSHDLYRSGRRITRSDDAPRLPVLDRKSSTCDECGQRYREDLASPYFRRYLPLVVTGKCPIHGFFFAPVKQSDLAKIAAAYDERKRLAFDPADFAITWGPKSKSLIDRGVNSYLDLFSNRQLLVLQEAITFLPTYDPLVRLNLALLVSTSLEFNSMLCGYKGSHRHRPGTIRHTFSRHAYSFPYTALENNPIYEAKSSGTLRNLFHSRIRRGRRWAMNPTERRIDGDEVVKVAIPGEVDSGTEVSRFNDLKEGSGRFLLVQGSSTTLDLPDGSVDYVVTDPPYFDSVQYSDLAAFFRVWLKQLLPEDINWEYASSESAVDQHANGDGQYTTALSGIFSECHRVLKRAGRLIFTFHHWNPKGWASLTIALKRAGFALVNRYVVHAENRASVHIANQNALLHDVILVLAPLESGITAEWPQPSNIDKSDSETFCRQCGAVVGWLLSQAPADSEIETTWQSLLS